MKYCRLTATRWAGDGKEITFLRKLSKGNFMGSFEAINIGDFNIKKAHHYPLGLLEVQ